MLKISVVLGVRNRDKQLQYCLKSLSKQDFPSSKFEVVVVNYGGTNQANKITQSFNQKNFKYIYCNERGLYNESRAKNIGLKASRGECVVFTNADIIFGKKMLSHISKLMHVRRDRLFLKKRLELPREFDLEKHFEKIIAQQEVEIAGLKVGPESAMGDFQVAPKKVLLKIQGYDEKMIGWGAMDLDLTQRLLENKVVLQRIDEFEVPIYHQFHEVSEINLNVKHNLNLIFSYIKSKKKAQISKWGETNKVYEIAVLSNNSEDVLKNQRKDIKIYRLKEKEKIWSKNDIDAIIFNFSKKNVAVDLIERMSVQLAKGIDVVSVESKKENLSNIVGMSFRCFAILEDHFGKNFNSVRFIWKKIVKRYYFTSTKVKSKLELNNYTFVDYVLHIYAALYWNYKRMKKIA